MSSLGNILGAGVVWIIANPAKALLALFFALLGFVFLLLLLPRGEEPRNIIDSPPAQGRPEVEASVAKLPLQEQAAYSKYRARLEKDAPTQKEPVSEQSAPQVHFDGSREEIRRREEVIQSQPVLYDLPYATSSIVAEYTDVLPDGRYLIRIRYRGSQERAEKAWQKKLRRAGDDGSSYVVFYRKAG